MTLIVQRPPVVRNPLGLQVRPRPYVERRLPHRPVPPKLSSLTGNFIAPQGALILGAALDGMPVMLDLRRAAPGPILIIGDAGSGKTRFLRVAAQSAAWSFDSSVLRFSVIASTPESWAGWDTLPHASGIWSAYDTGLGPMLAGLRKWAGRPVDGGLDLLLIDDLAALSQPDQPMLEDLNWLLLNGPAHGVWPIVTLNARLAPEFGTWLTLFKTRIFGWIEEEGLAGSLAAHPDLPAQGLEPGAQFCMHQHDKWLRFWLPTLS